MTEKMSENLLKKALDSNLGIMPPVDKKNGLDIPEFREPNFNELTIQKKIDELKKEISNKLMGAFTTKTVKGIPISGIDKSERIEIDALKVELNSLIESLKTEKLRCSCESKQFTRTVDEDSNPICGGCGKII